MTHLVSLLGARLHRQRLFGPRLTRGRAAFWVALLVPWLIVFALRWPRTFLAAMVNGELAGGMYVRDAIPYEPIARQHPQDVQVQVSVAENTVWQSPSFSYSYAQSSGYDDNGRTSTQALSKLVERFPTSALPPADYLRWALGWMQDARVAGDFENPNPPPYKKPSLEHARYNNGWGPLPTFTPIQLQRAITVSRHGQRLEPDNAYFDWVLVYLLLAGARDEEARQALHAGSLKGHYDDHALASIAAALHTSELARPLEIEQRLRLCKTNLDALSSHYHHAARLLAWQAWKAEGAGRHREAIALRADLARLAHLLHRSNTVETQQLAAQLQLTAWMGNPHPTIAFPQFLARLRQKASASSATYAQSFATYARAHGDEAAAREALQFAQDNVALGYTLKRSGYDTQITSFPLHNATLFALYRQVRVLFWLCAGITLQIPLLAGSYVALSLLLIRTARAPDETVRRALPPALLSFGFALGAALLLLPIILPAESAYWRDFIPTSARNQTQETLRIILGLVLLVLTPFVLPAAFWSFAAGRARRTWLRARPPKRESPLIPRDMRPLVWAFLLSSIVLGTLGGLGLALLVWLRQSSRVIVLNAELGWQDRERDFAPFLFLVGAGAAVLWLGGWLLKWRFFVAREERHLFQGALRRYRLTFGTLLLVSSWAYLLLFWLSLIPRRHAEQLLDYTLPTGIAVKVPPATSN